jgi:hypothetical protein
VTSLEADPLLRRLERRALVFCGLAAAVSLAAQGGRPEVALGVVGGGVLIGVSYWAIRSSIDGVLALGGMGPGRISGAREEIRPGPIPQGGRGRAIGYGLRFVGRYALLAGLAYVMLVWLRLHPVGLILGVSSIVVAAAIEAASTFGRPPKT